MRRVLSRYVAPVDLLSSQNKVALALHMLKGYSLTIMFNHLPYRVNVIFLCELFVFMPWLGDKAIQIFTL